LQRSVAGYDLRTAHLWGLIVDVTWTKSKFVNYLLGDGKGAVNITNFCAIAIQKIFFYLAGEFGRL
jgi:hypothetical protein